MFTSGRRVPADRYLADQYSLTVAFYLSALLVLAAAGLTRSFPRIGFKIVSIRYSGERVRSTQFDLA
jgi:hypothetical protein